MAVALGVKPVRDRAIERKCSMPKRLHRDPTINPYRDMFLGIRLTERLSDRLEKAAPINKSEWVRDAIETKLNAGAAE